MLTALLGRSSQRGWWHGPAYDAGERDNGQQIRNHLDELRWNELRSLKLDLQRLGCGEEQACQAHARWIPAPENRGRERNEASSSRHLIRELMLIEDEIHATETSEHSREYDGG